MFNRRLILLSLSVLFVMVFSPLQAAQAPKNVIYLIGDGMGVAQVTLARLTTGKPLAMDSMPVGGFVKTQSANAAVTDSGAAGTALATGFKTNNGMISTLPDGKTVQTILEAAAKTGRAVGIVTTVTITHATPASFGAHVAARASQADIAPQYLDKKIDVIMGGGRQFFIPKSRAGSKRTDETDLIARARSGGYTYVETAEELTAANGNKLLGLFEMDALSATGRQPPLARMTKKAISALSRDKDGFFVMIEGGQIDWRCHANDAAGTVMHMLDFDAAVGQALEYARKNGNTLVIVTADHETGGLTLLGSEEGGNEFTPTFSTTSHSAVNVPFFAYGPGSEVFGGVMDNTDIPKKIAKLWGVKGFAE